MIYARLTAETNNSAAGAQYLLASHLAMYVPIPVPSWLTDVEVVSPLFMYAMALGHAWVLSAAIGHSQDCLRGLG